MSVLAAIDTALQFSSGADYEGAEEDHTALLGARAAIDELIAADVEYDAAETEYVEHDKSLFKRDRLWYQEWERMEARCDAAIARRAAALARVRGAQ